MSGISGTEDKMYPIHFLCEERGRMIKRALRDGDRMKVGEEEEE